MLAAGLVAPALVFGWLAWRGGLAPFVTVFTGYVLPALQPRRPRPAVAALRLVSLRLGALGPAGGPRPCSASATPAPRRRGPRRRWRRSASVSGALHFALQGKGWEYQLYPLAVFLCALAPFALRRLSVAAWERHGHPSMPVRLPGLRRAAALVLFAATAMVLGAKGVDALDAPWIADKARRVAALTRDLAPLVPPGGTVQVMDVTEGGVHALWSLRLRQPTRFIYDFHFFHDTGDPRIQRAAGGVRGGARGARPAAIVVLRDTWNRRGYERLAGLARGRAAARALVLRLAVEGDGYRIYAKRS